MRYCIKCGNEMNDERFCVACGTDNGVPAENLRSTVASAAGGYGTQTIDLNTILHWSSVILFAVASLIFLVSCYGKAQDIIAQSMLYRAGWIHVCIYFVIGMWSVLLALPMLLNITDRENHTAIGASVVLIALIIIIAIVKAITAGFGGGAHLLSIVLAPYSDKIVGIIIVCVLSAAAGFIDMQKIL